MAHVVSLRERPLRATKAGVAPCRPPSRPRRASGASPSWQSPDRGARLRLSLGPSAPLFWLLGSAMLQAGRGMEAGQWAGVGGRVQTGMQEVESVSLDGSGKTRM